MASLSNLMLLTVTNLNVTPHLYFNPVFNHPKIMQKTIHTLIPDIQETLKGKGWFNKELEQSFTAEISSRLTSQYSPMSPERKPALRLSQMGPKCPCALWHSIHKPELAEPLPPWAEFKYSFGHIIEGLAIGLAKASGHTVLGEQDELSVDDVVGNRDCVIDGYIVDVKSTSSRSFIKFKDGSLAQSDSFGYLDQLDGYLLASANDPIVKYKDVGYLLAIDKQLGHMCLYEHRLRRTLDGRCKINERIANYKRIVEQLSPPACNCETVADGKSGNIKLGLIASYNPYKYCCFPNLRTFLYASGPVYLTKVVRTPDVTEVDKFGKIVYH